MAPMDERAKRAKIALIPQVWKHSLNAILSLSSVNCATQKS
jgi:hypothetical protein